MPVMKRWFFSSEDDEMLRTEYGPYISQIPTNPDHVTVPSDPEDVLALVLLTDQITRNIYRKSAQAFAWDAVARKLTKTAIENKWDVGFKEDAKRAFLYMPLEHSEDPQEHVLCVDLFSKLSAQSTEATAPTNQQWLKFAQDHKKIIDQFGRYPHRNEVLGRVSTPEEITYLEKAERYGQ
ncbi:hypothetical protein HK104_003653 [Borealophlyctis nickersoniae]|nr:hypothetical protein HK104_003653 [Borealophlyctis nickersoniae]